MRMIRIALVVCLARIKRKHRRRQEFIAETSSKSYNIVLILRPNNKEITNRI